MQKVHLTVLYLGLALAAAALVVMWLAYTEQQMRIVGLEEREQALDDGLHDLDAWVEYLYETQQNTKQSIAALDERSEQVTDQQNEAAVWADGIVQWQADVAAFMNRTRQPGVPAEWVTWRGSIDRRITNIQNSTSDNYADITSLYEWSDDVTAFLNSGQQPGTADTNAILLDFIRAYNGDPLAIARLPQHLATLSGG